MLYEYGLDPECLNEWNTFRFFMGEFGISRGRLISRFPKSWFKIVHEVCRNFTYRQRQIMSEELARIRKHALIKSGREFDHSKSWKANAIEQYGCKPFHAIITTENEDDLDFILISDQITANTPLWKVPREAALPRSVAEIGNAVRRLLNMSDQILFIDKLFDPAIQKWREMLCRFIELAIHKRIKYPKFEYHFMITDDNLKIRGKTVNFENYCIEHLGNALPDGIELKLVRWGRKEGGEGFHARYILTDRGGVRIDWGLDIGREGETTDVSLLENDLWKKRLNSFQKESTIFEFVDSTIVRSASFRR